MYLSLDPSQLPFHEKHTYTLLGELRDPLPDGHVWTPFAQPQSIKGYELMADIDGVPRRNAFRVLRRYHKNQPIVAVVVATKYLPIDPEGTPMWGLKGYRGYAFTSCEALAAGIALIGWEALEKGPQYLFPFVAKPK